MVDPCWQAAGRILQATGLSAHDHVAMQENLASYLVELKPDFVERLQREPQDNLIFSLRGGFAAGDMRWTQKLLRDVEQPYDDRAVLRHLDEVDAEFARTAPQMLAEPGPFPSRVFVTGSLLKGRFGAHSDVDVLQEGLRRFPTQHLSVQVLDGDEASRQRYESGFSPKVEVTSPAPGTLKHLFVDAMRDKGFEVEGDSIRRIDTKPRERDIQPAGASGMIWSFADLPV